LTWELERDRSSGQEVPRETLIKDLSLSQLSQSHTRLKTGAGLTTDCFSRFVRADRARRRLLDELLD